MQHESECCAVFLTLAFDSCLLHWTCLCHPMLGTFLSTLCLSRQVQGYRIFQRSRRTPKFVHFHPDFCRMDDGQVTMWTRIQSTRDSPSSLIAESRGDCVALSGLYIFDSAFPARPSLLTKRLFSSRFNCSQAEIIVLKANFFGR